MGILDLFKKTEAVLPPEKYFGNIKEGKGEVEQSISKKTQFLLPPNTEPRPEGFSIKRLRKIYLDEPFIFGAINKIVDFVVSPGFFIESKDDRVKEVCNQFIRDHQFSSTLRNFVLDALITGNAYLELSGDKSKPPEELRVLDPEFMFVQRDVKGEVIGYAQSFGFIGAVTGNTRKPILFKPHEIAHLIINSPGDSAYGWGRIHPALYSLSTKTSFVESMKTLMKRKANAPYHVKVGYIDPNGVKNVVPDATTLSSLSAEFEYLNDKHEWVTNPYVDIKTVETGKIGDKFSSPLEMTSQDLFYGLGVPPSLMGVLSVPEGLAKQQMKAFLFGIRAIQEEVEKVLEEKVFKRVVIGNGLDASDVEFEWGAPTPEDMRAELETLTTVLNTVRGLGKNFGGMFSNDFTVQIENRMRKLLDFDDRPDDDKDLEAPLPAMPPLALQRPAFGAPSNPEDVSKRKEPGGGKEPVNTRKDRGEPPEKREHVHEDFNEGMDLSIKEFVGFNYDEFLREVLDFIDSEDFSRREFSTFRFTNQERTEWEEFVSSYDLKESLGESKLSRLRLVLKDNFREGKSMRDIARDIQEVVKPGDLELFNDKGEVTRIVPEKFRAMSMARVEVVRASNQGALKRYDDLGVRKAKWIASIGERTCPYCESHNGLILDLSEAQERIPAHNLCRCSWGAVVEG